MSGERPEGEAVEHLWTAAHEFLQAVRKLVDAADDLVSQQRDAARATPDTPASEVIDPLTVHLTDGNNNVLGIAVEPASARSLPSFACA